MCGKHMCLYVTNKRALSGVTRPKTPTSIHQTHLLWSVNRPDLLALSLCSYFAVVVYKVLVLLIEELGGSNAFLTKFSGKTFRINTGPCCCCCMCLPRVPMSRYLFLFNQNSLLPFCSHLISQPYVLHCYYMIIEYSAPISLYWLCIVLLVHTSLLLVSFLLSGDCCSGWRWVLSSTPSWRRCSPSFPLCYGQMATLISQM